MLQYKQPEKSFLTAPGGLQALQTETKTRSVYVSLRCDTKATKSVLLLYVVLFQKRKIYVCFGKTRKRQRKKGDFPL